MTSWLRRVALVGVLGSAGLAMSTPVVEASASSQPGTASQFVGNYRFVGGQKQRRELEQRVDALVDEFNFFIRPIARRRMLDSNKVPPTIRVSKVGESLRIEIPGLRPIVAPTDGRAVIWRDQYGEDVKVSQKIVGRTLKQRFDGKEGDRDILYRVSADGARLAFIVTITSPRMPRPLHYQLSYRRS